MPPPRLVLPAAAKRVAADGAVRERRRMGGVDAAADAAKGGRVAADSAVGERRRGSRDAAARDGNVAADCAVLDGERARSKRIQRRHRICPRRCGPRWSGRASRFPSRWASEMPPPFTDARFPLTTRIAHDQVGIADPDASTIAGHAPVADRQAREHDLDRTRAGAEDVEHPVELLAIDDGKRPPRPPGSSACRVMSKSPVSVAVLARAGEGDLEDAGRHDDHVGPRQSCWLA